MDHAEFHRTLHAVDLPNREAVELISSVAGLAFALASLGIALVALRYAKEQARAYLFPVPYLGADSDRGAIVLRNLGGGAMVNIRIRLEMLEPDSNVVRIDRHLSNLIRGESAVVVGPDLLEPLALAQVRGTVGFENIRGWSVVRQLKISSEELRF